MRGLSTSTAILRAVPEHLLFASVGGLPEKRETNLEEKIFRKRFKKIHGGEFVQTGR